MLALLPAVLTAQGREFEAHVGPWAGGSGTTIYEVRTSAPAASAFMHGFQATLAVGQSGSHSFAGAGYDVEVLRSAERFGPYALAGAALGFSSDSGGDALAVLWSAGGGIEWRPLSFLAVGVEVRYAIEDRGPHGFWQGGGERGFGALVGASIGVGSRPATIVAPPAPATIEGGAADIVRTALDALGRPYQWGGTAENGFDCSGLVQYAYGEHGIRLPRRARDQAAAGLAVTPVVDALRPGDVLLFAAERGAGVTHVGLYAGEGKFIHSSGAAVKLSRLDPHDPEGAYWLARWVGARRMIP